MNRKTRHSSRRCRNRHCLNCKKIKSYKNNLNFSPKKLLSTYPTKYTKLRAKEFQPVERRSLIYYLLDAADEEWLASEEAAGNFIPPKTFVEVMNLFEVTAYKVTY